MENNVLAKIIFGLNNYDKALEVYNNINNLDDLLKYEYSGIFEKLIIFNSLVSESKIPQHEIIKSISESNKVKYLIEVYNKLLIEMYKYFGKLFVLLNTGKIPDSESDVILVLDELARIIKKYSIDTNHVQITEIIFDTNTNDFLQIENR